MSENSGLSAYNLLLASSQGDIEAFSILFERYSEKLFNFAYYLTYSREDSEDITSETFISVFQAIQGRDITGFNLQAYLYKTAKSASLKSIERRKRDGLTMEETMAFSDPNLFADPEKAALLSEQRELVRQTSEELTLDQQSALLLKELEGLPYNTIASILDSNPNAVGVLLTRARLKFREAFRMAHVAEPLTDECLSILPLLSKYLDNEATADEREVVFAHLSTCTTCKENLESMQEASVTYRSLIPFLPLASFKVWNLAKAAIAGKAVIGSVSSAGSSAGTAGAGAGGTAVSGGAASAGGAGATAAAVGTGAAATGLGLLTKLMIVISTILVLGGAGAGGYFAYRALTTNPLDNYKLASPRNAETVTLEETGGVVTVPIEVSSKSGNYAIDVMVDGNLAKTTEQEGGFTWSTDKPGRHTISIKEAKDSSKNTKQLAAFSLVIKRVTYPLVFSRNSDIWIAQLDKDFNLIQGSEKDLTSSPEVEDCPAISPDGKSVAYLSEGFAKINMMDSNGQNQHVLVDRQDKPTGLTDKPVFAISYSTLSWYGDGKYLLCNGQDGPSYAANKIWKIDPTNGSLDELSDTDPGIGAIAKDGSEVWTIVPHAGSNLDSPVLYVELNGKSSQLFNRQIGWFSDLSWASDSSFFSAYNDWANGAPLSEIWFVDKGGNVIRRIPSQFGGYLCPDSKHFYGVKDGIIYVWDVDNTSPRAVTTGENPSLAVSVTLEK